MACNLAGSSASRLWLNPAAEVDPSVAATDTAAATAQPATKAAAWLARDTRRW